MDGGKAALRTKCICINTYLFFFLKKKRRIANQQSKLLPKDTGKIRENDTYSKHNKANNNNQNIKLMKHIRNSI
jgi:hypothetical protein